MAGRELRAAIFDLDGTLVDTEGATSDWIADYLRPHGLTWTPELHARVTGTEHFFPERCLDLLEVPPARKEELLAVLPPRLTCPEYTAFVASRMTIKPGAVALIQRLRSRRLPLGLCTSRRADSVAGMLAARPDLRALLAPLAVRVEGSTDPRTGEKLPSKPNPHGYQVCAELLGVEPSSCIVFEDAPSGIKAAKAAGAFTVAVPERWMDGNAEAEKVTALADLRLASLLDVREADLLGPAAPLLLACGNPTVDLTCELDPSELAGLGMSPGSDSAGLDDAAKAAAVAVAVGREGASVSPGGAALNAVRVAAWAGGAALRAAFVGSVGQDAHGALLREAMAEVGVVPLLHEAPGLATGVSASLVDRASRDRSLATVRGAAGALGPEFLEEPGVAALVEEASLLYMTSFLLSTEPRIAAAKALAEKVCGRGAALAVNLSSAGILPKVRGPLLELLPRCRYAFGNLAELRALAALLGWPDASGEALTVRFSELLAEGGHAIITAGPEPTLAAKRGGGVLSFAVPAVPACEVVDTNAAGDAFVGGFLAEALANGSELDACVAAGHRSAGFVLRRRGCELHA